MPTYEYECQRCSHTFERFQSMTDEPLKRCPKCKGKIRRMIGTGAGLLFKGSGFYITDYRNENYRAAQKSEQSKASGSETDSATKKPAETKKTAETKKPAETKKTPSKSPSGKGA